VFGFSQRGAVRFIEAEELSALGFVTHAFCTRRGGVSRGPFSDLNVGDRVGDREEDVRRNLDLVGEAFAVPKERLVMMRQAHGDSIRVLDGDGPLPEELPVCDGLITDRKGVALGVRTADCVSLFFVDRVRRVIGAAHAGWRGAALGMAAKMVDTLGERFSSRNEDILAVIGPAIGPCCYEVDAPVFQAFSARCEADKILVPCRGKDRWMLDLVLANRMQLLERGVPEGNILSTGYCTSCREDLFFSHRARRGRTGRQINLLMLRGGGDEKIP
jgi:YfiH family protein